MIGYRFNLYILIFLPVSAIVLLTVLLHLQLKVVSMDPLPAMLLLP